MIKDIRGGVWYKPDGKELCNGSAAGLREYRRRTVEMADRQGGMCAHCGKPLYDPITFDHENGRGGGKHDDRIEVDGVWQNAALHWICNSVKSSRRMPYKITQETINK